MTLTSDQVETSRGVKETFILSVVKKGFCDVLKLEQKLIWQQPTARLKN